MCLGNDSNRWLKIIWLISIYRGKHRNWIIDTDLTVQFTASGKAQLRQEVKRFIQIHISRTEKERTLTKIEIQKMQDIHDRLIESEVEKYCWYFDTKLMRQSNSRERTQQERRRAMKSLLPGIIELSTKVIYSFEVGHSLAETNSELFGEICQYLISEKKLSEFARGYLSESYQLHGISWLRENILQNRSRLDEATLVLTYLSVEACPEIWQELSLEQNNIESLYWKNIYQEMSPWVSNQNQNTLVQKLNQHKKFSTVFNYIYMLDERCLEDATIIDFLTGLAPQFSKKIKVEEKMSYDLRILFRRLRNNKTNRDIVISLELQYSRLLAKYGNENFPFYLHEELSTNPARFVELISLSHLPDESTWEQYLKEEKPNWPNLNNNAAKILETWTQAPGTAHDGNVDFEVLRVYMETAITLCDKTGRKNIGVFELGELLGRTKLDEQGRPHSNICEIIETLNHKELRKGFSCAYTNRRDKATTLKPHDLATSFSSCYPVTAGIFRRLAESNERFAKEMTKIDT